MNAFAPMSMKRLPTSLEEAKSDLKRFFDEDRMKKFQEKGRFGAKLFGVTVLAGILSAYSPESMAMQPGAGGMTSVGIFMHVMDFAQNTLPNGAEFVRNASLGAIEGAGALAVNLQENVIAPSVGAIRSSGSGMTAWLETQKEALTTFGVSTLDGLKDVADYLMPKSKGEMVERAIVILAALKSFSEGVELAVKGVKSLGRRLFGMKADVAPPPQETVTKVEVHHHYYGDAAPRPDPKTAPAPEVEDVAPEVTVISPTHDAANDNSFRLH